jgi:hypothetical protein
MKQSAGLTSRVNPLLPYAFTSRNQTIEAGHGTTSSSIELISEKRPTSYQISGRQGTHTSQKPEPA